MKHISLLPLIALSTFVNLLQLPSTEGTKVLKAVDSNFIYLSSPNSSPFFPPQIGDTGLVEVTSSSSSGLLRVLDTQKAAGGGALFMHRAIVEAGTVTIGASASAKVDVAKRRRSQCHHTATHLLQAALKKVVGQDVSQVRPVFGGLSLFSVASLPWAHSTQSCKFRAFLPRTSTHSKPPKLPTIPSALT